MERIEVGAAVIVRDGRYLVSRRRAGAHLGGYWEFPGGKREAGESFEECLRREIAEELGVAVTVGKRICRTEHAYAERTVEIVFHRCEIEKGEPRAIGCDEVRWASRDDLAGLSFPPADREVIRKLLSG